MPNAADVIAFLQQFAPLELAEEWDNVGLLLGDASAPAERIMTCLTVTPSTAQEAIAATAGLIVTHHPVLFRGRKRLTAHDAEGAMLLGLIRAGVAVYSPHTALDATRGGINDMIAGWLGLTGVRPLRPARTPVAYAPGSPGQYKVVVFVPDKDLARVSDAMFAAGAGHIGQYSQCGFRIPGTGTFFGSDASNPTIGAKGRREEVSELRLEIVCGGEVLPAVIAALRQAHSYEEPAFDIYPLAADPTKVPDGAGQGRVGRLGQPASLADLAQAAKKALRASLVQKVGDAARQVQHVAIACGSGGGFVQEAARAGADVLVTGEASFHDCLAAQSLGLAMLLVGHYASERPGVEELAGVIGRQFPDAKVWASLREGDPLH